ncbi:hypothetical protein YC2023_048287 [Brassica napus]
MLYRLALFLITTYLHSTPSLVNKEPAGNYCERRTEFNLFKKRVYKTDLKLESLMEKEADAAEVADQITSQEAGVTRADGKQQGSRKRLISLVDDTDDSDVEISQPTQKTKPCRHTSFGTATRKPMLQSTIDGGVGSSA